MGGAGKASQVCVANVYMAAWGDLGFLAIVNAADLVTPDNMPMVWVLCPAWIAPHDERINFLMSVIFSTLCTLHLCF